jgi:hypothetical protein
MFSCTSFWWNVPWEAPPPTFVPDHPASIPAPDAATRAQGGRNLVWLARDAAARLHGLGATPLAERAARVAKASGAAST